MMFRKYKVLIDNEKFTIKRGETKELNIAEGKHKMTVEIDFVRSQYIFLVENTDKKELTIKHRIPKIFPFFFLSVATVLIIFSYFSAYSFSSVISICILASIIPLIYITIAKMDNYFIIKEH